MYTHGPHPSSPRRTTACPPRPPRTYAIANGCSVARLTC
uniref:Uncharacterized protein n=1 Tax=Arundo donax TaxID=35708 RepID=A0A0A9AS61_ARUDO